MVLLSLGRVFGLTDALFPGKSDKSVFILLSFAVPQATNKDRSSDNKKDMRIFIMDYFSSSNQDLPSQDD